MKKVYAMLIMVVAVVMGGYAFEPVAKESAKALKVSKNKDKITTGLVFINGRFIAPPYTVERYGTVIRINKHQVTEEIVPWAEFLRTQNGFRVLKEEAPAAPAATNEPPASAEATPPPPPEPPAAPAGPIATAAASDDDDEDSLDDLFDDLPVAKKKAKKPKKAESRKPFVMSKPKPAKPAGPKITGYAIDGEFIPNDRTKAMVGKINAVRTDIDLYLRNGGFIFFGDGYSRVQGDESTANDMLRRLPEMMQHANTVEDLRSGLRAARMDYIHEAISQGLFENRVDYRRLQEHRERVEKARKFKELLNSAGGSAI